MSEPDLDMEELNEDLAERYGAEGGQFAAGVIQSLHNRGVLGTFVLFVTPDYKAHAFSHAQVESVEKLMEVLGPALAKTTAVIANMLHQGMDVGVEVTQGLSEQDEQLAAMEPAGRA